MAVNLAMLKQAWTQPLPVSVAKKADLLKLRKSGIIRTQFHSAKTLSRCTMMICNEHLLAKNTRQRSGLYLAGGKIQANNILNEPVISCKIWHLYMQYGFCCIYCSVVVKCL